MVQILREDRGRATPTQARARPAARRSATGSSASASARSATRPRCRSRATSTSSATSSRRTSTRAAARSAASRRSTGIFAPVDQHTHTPRPRCRVTVGTRGLSSEARVSAARGSSRITVDGHVEVAGAEGTRRSSRRRSPAGSRSRSSATSRGSGPPVGACRMCLVRDRGDAEAPGRLHDDRAGRHGRARPRRPRTKAAEGQEATLEFILVNHPLDCPVCDKGGECPLQDLTFRYGPGHDADDASRSAPSRSRSRSRRRSRSTASAASSATAARASPRASPRTGSSSRGTAARSR